MGMTLEEARAKREGILLEEALRERLSVVLSERDASWEAREEVVQLMKHYAQSPRPYRQCVEDNMKRLGPGNTENFCATLKDMIRGMHRWVHVDSRPKIALSQATVPEISKEADELLLSLSDTDLEQMITEASNGR